MNPCAFTWEPPTGPYISVEVLGGPIHVCVLEKNHKGDHTAVDGERRAVNPHEILVDRLPMHVNLGSSDWHSHIGWAKVTRDPETGRNKIVIDLDEESSGKLGSMVDMFKLYAVGFAGIKKRPDGEPCDARR